MSKTLFFLLICVSPLAAQVSARLSGTATDASGALVQSSAITVTNTGTGAVRHADTDRAGRYLFPELAPGEYEIRAQKAGFQEEVRSGVNLAVGQDVIVDFSLKVGELTQQVAVNADAPVVNLTPADSSGLINRQQFADLPINGRSFDELLTLNPGIVNFTWEKFGGTGVSNSTNANNFSVEGNRPQQNLFLLNGVEFTGAAENNMQPGGVSGILLGMDAVQEFNVLRDSYSAEYGKHPGGQILTVTRSGVNQLQGSLYEYLRNSAFDARNFFDGANVSGLERNQFGGAVGGALKKNKTFYFTNFEQFLQHFHQTGVDLVPDNNARNGMLPCALVTGLGACPASGLQFVGVSPLINAWPTPTPGAPDFGGIAEALNSPLQTIRDTFGTARIDHIFSGKDRMSAIYTADDSSDFTPTTVNAWMADTDSLREQVASVEETHIFSPSLINTARVGFSRAGYFFTGEPTPGTPAASLPGLLSGDIIGALTVGGSAASNPATQIGLAGANNGSNLHVARNLYTYTDNLSFTHGRHQITFGGWFQRLQSNELLALSQYGQASFTSIQTFLAGTIATLTFDPKPTEMGWRSLYGAEYIQDTIRLMPRLTITLGLRDEFDTGWNEATGRASNYAYTNGIISSQPAVGNSVFTVNNAKFLPQPRVGLAWSPFRNTSKTVIRAGFGMYNDLQDALGYRTDQNAPFNTTYSESSVPVSSLPILTSAAIPASAHIVPGGVQPNLKTPTVLSWTLRVQQELTRNTSLTVGYVGNHGYHELLGVDANEPLPVICPASPCPAAYPSNFPVGIAGTPVPAGTYYVPSSTKPTTNLANTWTYFSEGDSSYNALQIDLNHRFSHGLAVRGVYTWSKALDDGDSPNATTSGNEPALVANPFNIRADWGPANYDVRNVAAINASYALPFEKGNVFVKGWTVNSIVTLQSGFPFTPQLSYNPANTGDTKDPVRPFVNASFTGPVILGNPNQWFNPAAFLPVPNNSGFEGNLGRDTLIGPGLATWDFSLMKDTPIRERARLQFRAEFFNILNHANFNTPTAITFTPSGTSPTAGLITSTSTSSRQIQLGLKLLW